MIMTGEATEMTEPSLWELMYSGPTTVESPWNKIRPSIYVGDNSEA